MQILHDRKFVVIVLLFILFASVYRVMYLKYRGVVIQEPVEPTKVTYLPGNELAPELPNNLPLEEGVPLIRNEIVEVKGSTEVQHIRMYYSKKTVKENYNIYKKYLLDNGWKVSLENSQDNFANLIGDKEGNKGTLSVNISKNSITNDITVEINVVLR